MKLFFAALALLLSFQCASAQTTQPADHGWPRAVNDLSRVLVDGDIATLGQMLTDSTVIRSFDGKKYSDGSPLLERTTRSTPLGGHAYINPPLAMAADIAVDFKTATIVPDDVRKKMVPEDDDAMKRANATAVQWIEQALGAKDRDYVAVFVFWSPKPPGPDDTDTANPPMQPMFVLVKASEASPGVFKIDQIAYGNPLEK